ncbi:MULTISPECIES: hypothetical protein [Cyanophyceae]|uniref:hypothetical protein n=1 Tax=Cyanophyceae TaxID=3028117 RepID=UPI00016DCE46|nr:MULTISPECIES: hypothetical protein [Cyanophyceae]ACB00919.1 hypothetical protein SYNPCC7002_E0027 [Picosynechococcus sp. PCC 7002]SMH58028.1 hypothetical protein SAMN06272755_3118 [Picosynechococcus sp. OG1]SMQ86500.1 hypothetical protein SAMN06272774_3250 [Synechococcus sp. 7002]
MEDKNLIEEVEKIKKIIILFFSDSISFWKKSNFDYSKNLEQELHLLNGKHENDIPNGIITQKTTAENTLRRPRHPSNELFVFTRIMEDAKINILYPKAYEELLTVQSDLIRAYQDDNKKEVLTEFRVMLESLMLVTLDYGLSIKEQSFIRAFKKIKGNRHLTSDIFVEIKKGATNKEKRIPYNNTYFLLYEVAEELFETNINIAFEMLLESRFRDFYSCKPDIKLRYERFKEIMSGRNHRSHTRIDGLQILRKQGSRRFTRNERNRERFHKMVQKRDFYALLSNDVLWFLKEIVKYFLSRQ